VRWFAAAAAPFMGLLSLELSRTLDIMFAELVSLWCSVLCCPLFPSFSRCVCGLRISRMIVCTCVCVCTCLCMSMCFSLSCGVCVFCLFCFFTSFFLYTAVTVEAAIPASSVDNIADLGTFTSQYMHERYMLDTTLIVAVVCSIDLVVFCSLLLLCSVSSSSSSFLVLFTLPSLSLSLSSVAIY
jgi:hypothetical protein